MSKIISEEKSFKNFIQIKKKYMENNLEKIVLKVHSLIHTLAPTVTGENAEMEIVYSIVGELLSEMGEIEQYDNVEKALVNMFFAGRMFPDKSS